MRPARCRPWNDPDVVLGAETPRDVCRSVVTIIVEDHEGIDANEDMECKPLSDVEILVSRYRRKHYSHRCLQFGPLAGAIGDLLRGLAWRRRNRHHGWSVPV